VIAFRNALISRIFSFLLEVASTLRQS